MPSPSSRQWHKTNVVEIDVFDSQQYNFYIIKSLVVEIRPSADYVKKKKAPNDIFAANLSMKKRPPRNTGSPTLVKYLFVFCAYDKVGNLMGSTARHA